MLRYFFIGLGLFLVGLFVLFLWWIRLAVKRWNMEEQAS